MKKLLAAMLLALGTLGVAAQETTVSNPSRGFLLRFVDFSYTQLPGPVFRFKLRNPRGRVQVSSTRQGIELFAPAIDVDAISQGGKQADSIKVATATGGVRAIRRGKEDRSEVTGATAKYAVRPGGADLTVTGPVKITNFQGDRRTLQASGRSLANRLSSGGELVSATLNGPVVANVRQAAQAGRESTDLNLTAAKMVWTPQGGSGSGASGTLTLTGSVKIRGLVGVSQIQGGFARVNLRLNGRGEVVSFEGSN